MKRDHESGASLVELALLTPFLILLLFGVMEFAWLFYQNLDVRHGAREAARLAAANFPDGPVTTVTPSSGKTDDLVAEVCLRMDSADGVLVTLSSTGDQGDAVQVEVSAPAQTLTGFFDWTALQNLVLSSTAEGRLQYDATWVPTTDQACP